jgi:hypothetical protein
MAVAAQFLVLVPKFSQADTYCKFKFANLNLVFFQLARNEKSVFISKCREMDIINFYCIQR